ncbi:MAG: hypothetical protein KGI45_04125 [Patescibacteria group bacterium]|nr:hypothetical protein [Patescibacteria group bacterium]MDE1941388.1 hypothetical protein [Patescibacteria group bacterium]MDE1967222.1 hypothetical protein [Patescibacteria group bacterium]
MKSFRLVSTAVLAIGALIVGGCATNRTDFQSSSLSASIDLSKGKPVATEITETKSGGGILIIPVAFASSTRAYAKLKQRLVSEGVLTQSGVTADGRHFRKIIPTHEEQKPHGMWFLLGWVRSITVSADVWEFPLAKDEQAAPTLQSSLQK